jgi:NADP-dependent 3-hydroxy acid dehydrogenase YdfG
MCSKGLLSGRKSERWYSRKVENLSGKVAVVTGAASGIGLALAHRFVGEGMKLVAADLDQDGLSLLEKSLHDIGADVSTFVLDVSKENEVNDLARFSVETFGAVHVLCNNAGVGLMSDPWNGTLQVWERTIGINLYSVIYGVRAFLPIMNAQGEGHIVNTASMAGLLAIPGGGPYTVTKHGVVALSEGLYLENKLSGSPVEVSVLCPAWVKTNIAQAATEAGGSDVSEATANYVRQAVQDGIDPASVAEQVVQAILAQQFWILTHPETRSAAVQRMQRAADGENPQLTSI